MQTPLTASRVDPAQDATEAEPVLVDVEDTEAVVVLDDGTELRFDLVELLSALGSELAA